MTKENNRVGKFKLSRWEVERWQEMIPIMGNFFIVKAEFDFATDDLRVVALSPLFESWEPYCEPPEYEVRVTLNDFGPATVTAERKKPS